MSETQVPVARFTTSELATVSGLSAPTVAFLVQQGLLFPSLGYGVGRGRSHAWSFDDLVAATALTRLQKGVDSAKKLQPLMAYFRSPPGMRMIKGAVAQNDRKLLLISGDGQIEQGQDILGFMKRTKSTVVHVVDLGQLVEDVMLPAAEMTIMGRKNNRRPPRAPRRPRTKRTGRAS